MKHAEMLYKAKLTVVVLLSIPNMFQIKVDCKNVGLVYSPFIKKGDRETSTSYTKEMVKIMLEEMVFSGYTIVSTYGVGSPKGPFNNESLSRCTSIGHTSMGVAEINTDKKRLALRVYLGLYSFAEEKQTNCEVEVGFEMAKLANKLFNGTVQAIVYPSITSFEDLFVDKNGDSIVNENIKIVSRRALDTDMLYGIRISNCQQIPTGDWSKFEEIAELCDFIICLILPGESNFKFGIEEFRNMAVTIVRQTEDYLEAKMNSTRKSMISVILETGWPADADLKPPNTVHDLMRYWTLISDWASETGKLVFMHEFVDNPWKDTQWPLSGHFGRWEYNIDEPNLLSKNSLKLKHDKLKSVLGPAFLTYSGTSVGVVVVISLIAMIVLLYKRVRRIEGAAAAQYTPGDHEVKTFFEGVNGDVDPGEYVGDVWEKSPYNRQLEIMKSVIKIDKSEEGLLGRGEFGFVYKGKLSGDHLPVMGGDANVAVKMTGPCSTKEQLKCILSEIKMLGYLGPCPYICNILGAVTKDVSRGIAYFAMELCAHGSIKSYLLKNKTKFAHDLAQARCTSGNDYVFQSTDEVILMTERQLVRWAFEIASAMKFISSKNVIHSDLAARNVLLTAGHTTKVTDFGLSRRTVSEYTNYSKSGGEPLPWKWLSPESLELRIFSTKSDVWSYAVTLWEILSLGSSPKYGSVHSWTELLVHLQSGNRLDTPEIEVSSICSLMEKCWSFDPTERPTFTAIVQLLMSTIDNDYKTLTE